LQLIVDAYNKTDNPGRFELRIGDFKTLGERFSIVGTSAHDQTGKLVSQKSPLDSPVTLTAEEKPAIDIVTSICEQANKDSHQTISVGVYPRHVLGVPVNPGAATLPAREALAKVLNATGKNLYWRMLYDPDSEGYFLNLHILQ
jgi:hypothetical protein